MTEQFAVDAGHVAGYGQLCGEVARDVNGIGWYVDAEASAAHGFDGGLMELLAPTVDGYAQTVAERIRSRGMVLDDTEAGLRDSAWAYLGADRPERYTTLQDEAGRGMGVVEVDHPGQVPYPHVSASEGLTTPELEDAQFEKLMEDHAGDTLGAIDLIIRTVTGLIPGVDEYSITEELTDQLTGNWMALTQKAAALDQASDAAESAADSLQSGLSTVDAHWDGAAGRSFTSYVQRLIDALRYEAPLNRVVAFAYRTVADLIAKLAGVVVELISAGVEMIRKWVGGVGGRALSATWDFFTDAKPPWEAAKEDWDQAKEFFDRAKYVIQEVHQLPEDLQALVDAMKSPDAATDYSLNIAIAELGEREDEAAGTTGTADQLGLAKDFSLQVGPELPALAAGVDDFTNAPDSGFGVDRDLLTAS